MVSRTRMTELVRGHDAEAVRAALAESPELLAFKDERGRGWLHLCCMSQSKGPPEDAIGTADVLLAAGLGLDAPAFTEGTWQATPLWHVISRGRNLALAEHLLKLGCNPNFSLFACCFNSDLEGIGLLVRYGADLEERAEGGTPLIGAVGWSKFAAAEALLKHGADVNAQDDKGRTALHLMLKKDSAKAHFHMLMAYGPKGDLADASGATARQIMRRKKDAEFRAWAERLS